LYEFDRTYSKMEFTKEFWNITAIVSQYLLLDN
jgi:hypothetical protein